MYSEHLEFFIIHVNLISMVGEFLLVNVIAAKLGDSLASIYINVSQVYIVFKLA